ncbi:zinc finger protein GIS2-like [Helianthus annuus]|uniref:zinc finger protein GIS2-like n=1 Tax=Helianthus annuus TaxID=4232 RepID=UPI000B908733|nr:zinc finger protein GIS2-like [Helianthus annuus]
MADPSETPNHPVNQNDDARLNLTGTELQAMIVMAVNNAVDRALKEHKRKSDDTPSKGCKKGKASPNCSQFKPKEAKPECKTCGKKHFGKCFYEQTKGCVICKEVDPETHKCKDSKDNQQLGKKTKCKICKKNHHGKCRFKSRPLSCGICKTKEHKTLDCPKLGDATCYGCKEIGHIKTNCPNKTEKPGKTKKNNAGNSQVDAQEANQDANTATGNSFIINAHARVLLN